MIMWAAIRMPNRGKHFIIPSSIAWTKKESKHAVFSGVGYLKDLIATTRFAKVEIREVAK